MNVKAKSLWTLKILFWHKEAYTKKAQNWNKTPRALSAPTQHSLCMGLKGHAEIGSFACKTEILLSHIVSSFPPYLAQRKTGFGTAHSHDQQVNYSYCHSHIKDQFSPDLRLSPWVCAELLWVISSDFPLQHFTVMLWTVGHRLCWRKPCENFPMIPKFPEGETHPHPQWMVSTTSITADWPHNTVQSDTYSHTPGSHSHAKHQVSSPWIWKCYICLLWPFLKGVPWIKWK